MVNTPLPESSRYGRRSNKPRTGRGLRQLGQGMRIAMIDVGVRDEHPVRIGHCFGRAGYGDLAG